MAILLLILSLVSAAVDIVKLVQFIWGLIGQVHDRPTRMSMRRQLRTLVMHHADQEHKLLHAPDDLRTSLGELCIKAQQVIAHEHKQFLGVA